jgi:hypothetical protein
LKKYRHITISLINSIIYIINIILITNSNGIRAVFVPTIAKPFVQQGIAVPLRARKLRAVLSPSGTFAFVTIFAGFDI